ncbi:ribonuclease III [Maritalea porphyrae]|uniref:ribonuclease III n=1 Tax=Maritalea porphyrae TaxID=880732 RepID=UPI0022AFB5FA|nr:ribonuclease III [Maritalea porphyrae]MCZ4270846.1 ribonuclease III [Maritalea porphyrae]
MSKHSHALDELETRIGYQFRDTSLLQRAVTHSSAVAPTRRTQNSYQRLEFLGDRVLGLVVADRLLRDNTGANEGGLSRALNSVVRKESCAEVARKLDVGPALILGQSEAKTGGASKEAILGDVCEAIIGALYVDGGLETARAFIEKRFSKFIKAGTEGRGDAKTSLQEWAQSRSLSLPEYVEVARNGPDHAPEFTIEVRIDKHEPASSSGKSKKFAEHEAASLFLVREGIWSEDDE